MKINPIQVVCTQPRYSVQPQKEETIAPTETALSLPISDNYGRALVFKGISDKTKEIVKNASFDDKLAVGLKQLKQTYGMGNFLCVVNDIKNIPDIMSMVYKRIPISKLLVIQQEEFEDSLVLTYLSFNNRTIVINTNDLPIYTSMLEPISSGDMFDLNDEDFFRLPSCWVQIKEGQENQVLEENSDLFIKVFDFDKEIQDMTIRHNKSINRLLKDYNKPPTKTNQLTGFAAIGGQDKTIDSLKKSILFPLKYPDVFDGFMVSRGAILYGPPGTGKTLLAKTLAAESGASVFELCGTDLADKWVGGSEKNCRDLFQKAVEAQPSIIYFDEIDALGKKRGDDKHADKLLAQFLSLMSDLEKRNDNVYIIGSTNRKEDLDPAFVRSGRFGALLEVKAPDLEGTKQILAIHTKGKPIDKDFDIDLISEKMFAKKMTGADIAATVKEAFSHALERTGIYESMDSGRFSPEMKNYLMINNDDFINAISEFKANANQRNPIGYNK